MPFLGYVVEWQREQWYVYGYVINIHVKFRNCAYISERFCEIFGTRFLKIRLFVIDVKRMKQNQNRPGI